MAYFPPKYVPGDPIRAARMNEMNEAIRQIGARQRNRPHPLLNQREKIFLRVTGTANGAGAYPWVEVYAAPGGTWFVTDRAYSAAVDPAFPIDGDLTLLADDRVYTAMRAPTSGCWLFE